MENEQFSPGESSSVAPRRQFAPRWLLGLLSGVIVGLAWGMAAGSFLYDPDEFQKPYFLRYLAAMLASMSLTGLLVGIIRGWPELFGGMIGSWGTTVFFVALTSRELPPPFGILMVMFLLALGAIGGAITGLLLRLLTRLSSSS